MKEIGINEIKNISMEVLIDFDRVCRANHLVYSIAYGTLLGAIRHKGFIPWDDDIDVIMPREDFEKFLRVRNQLQEKYVFISTDTSDIYTAPLAKIYDSTTLLQEPHHNDRVDLGVYIDIFVYDYIPDSKIAKFLLFKRARVSTKIWGFATYSPRTKWWIERIGRRFALKHGWGRKASISMNHHAKKQKKASKMSNLLYSTYGYNKDAFPTDKLLDVSPLLFEGKEVLAFTDWHYFLTQWYGDYMQLPPKEKQITHHSFTVRYRE